MRVLSAFKTIAEQPVGDMCPMLPRAKSKFLSARVFSLTYILAASAKKLLCTNVPVAPSGDEAPLPTTMSIVGDSKNAPCPDARFPERSLPNTICEFPCPTIFSAFEGMKIGPAGLTSE